MRIDIERRVLRCLATFSIGVSLLAGCATKVELVATDPGFSARLAGAPLVALGGVSIAPMVAAKLTDADASDADEALYRAFLKQGRGLQIWPRGVVDGRLEPGALAALVDEYGRLGRLRPDQVVPLGPSFDDCRFFALARLTYDRTRTLAPERDTGDSDSHADGVPERGDNWNRSVLTQREIGVTLEVFDVETGASVWRADATSREQQRYEYENPLANGGTDYVRDRLQDSSKEDTLAREGTYLRSPDVVVLMEQAFGELARRLPLDGS